MKKLWLPLLIVSLNTTINLAHSQNTDQLVGTYGVTFQPSQAGGELVGCTLVYRAVQADHAYLKGNLVVVIGNIGVQQFGGNLLLSLKVGVKGLNGNQETVPPHFAYLQTKTKSTAKVKQTAANGDEGFRLFAYSLFEPTVLDLFQEMTDSGKVTIGFNRNENGLDVLVPVDIEVIDVESPGGNRLIRKRSKDTLPNFLQCFSTLIKQAKSHLDK